jgi:hypothetical protein
MIKLETDDGDIHIQLQLDDTKRNVMVSIDDKIDKTKKYVEWKFEKGWITLPSENMNGILLDGRANNRLQTMVFDLTMHQMDLDALSKDTEFMRSLDQTKKRFDSAFEILMKMRMNS